MKLILPRKTGIKKAEKLHVYQELSRRFTKQSAGIFYFGRIRSKIIAKKFKECSMRGLITHTRLTHCKQPLQEMSEKILTYHKSKKYFVGKQGTIEWILWKKRESTPDFNEKRDNKLCKHHKTPSHNTSECNINKKKTL